MRHNVEGIKKLMRNSGGQPVYKAFTRTVREAIRGFGKREERSTRPQVCPAVPVRKLAAASNRLAWKLAEIRDKVKRRQTSWEIKRSDFKIKQSLPMSERPWMVTFP